MQGNIEIVGLHQGYPEVVLTASMLWIKYKGCRERRGDAYSSGLQVTPSEVDHSYHLTRDEMTQILDTGQIQKSL